MRMFIETMDLIDRMFRTQTFGISVLLAVLFSLPLTADAQVTMATITGTVSDPSGAQVPSASVSVRNIDTGLKRTVVSGEDGAYRIEFLPVGNYVIEVTATSGFKKAYRDGIVLRVNDILRVDFALEVGNVAEVVTVTTAPPDINTSSPELGRTVQSREIENLPLVERNVYTLLDLTPGVQSNNNGVFTASTGTSSFILGYPEQRTLINGGTDGGTGSVNYYLDGGINMTNLRNTGNILPNPDAIQEFKVQTNSYNAEYGRFASGVINVLTKSGGNKFHGSLFEFVRNDIFNANDYASTLDKAPYHRNQFGGTIGGPIKTDKAFFFFSYAGLRQATSTFLNGARVPTSLEREGNFTQSLGTRPIDPATGASFVCNGVTHVICPNRIDPVARAIVDTYIPLPNMTLPNGNPGWQGNIATPYNFDEYLGKVDYQLNEEHRLSFSYFNTGGTSRTRGGNGNLPWSFQDSTWRQHSVNLSDVWVVSPDKINQVWLTFSRNFGGRINSPGTSLTDLGSAFTIQGTPNLPQITVNGYFTLGQQIGGPTAGTNFYAIRDVFSWTNGAHSLKFGGEFSLNKDIQDTLLNNYGVFTFNGGATRTTAGTGGNGYADFLLGIPSAVSQDAPVTAYTNTWYVALFVQDDYRVNSRLMINFGLRWDVQTPPTDPYDRVVNYQPGQRSDVNPIAPIGALFYGDRGVERGGIPTDYSHFSPRIGFAWDIFGDGKTSLRGAFGIFYGSISGNEWNTMTNFQPFSTRLTFPNINQRTNTQGVPLGATLVNPYNAFPGGNPFPYQGTFTPGGGLFPVASDFVWPRTYQMNVSIQRQLTKDWVVGAAYVGTESRNLPFARDINYPVLTSNATTGNILARRPNPSFGAILLLQSDQRANYHGLQVTTAYRTNRYLTFNAFYTFSKTLSSVQLYNSTTQGLAQNYTELFEDKGAGDTDQRHVFNLSLNFRPDFYQGDNRVAKALLNGWSISPIVKVRSGLPFTILNGADANLDGVNTDRAQLIGDPHLDNPTAAMWFNTAAFAQNRVITGVAVDGTSPRNFLYGPGYRVMDLAVSRDIRFSEKYKVTLRAEGTNIFNIVNLGQPGATVPAAGQTSPSFGVITSASAMRKLQFGARFTF